MNVAAACAQINNGIDNLLARSVKGHISTAFYLELGNTPALQFPIADQQVPAFGATPDRNRRRVASKEESVWNQILPAPLDQLPLQFPGARIILFTQIDNS
jgi:hypothetical protein